MTLEIFKNSDFEIRGGLFNNEPYFLATDICSLLGYSNARDAIYRHCDLGDVVKHDTPTVSGIQAMNYINESGLYALIFSSKLEKAKIFKKWVTSEVLPTIRKHGIYATNQTIEEMLSSPDTMITILENLKKERAEKQQALDIIEQQRPRVEFANRLQNAEGTLSIQDLAKLFYDKGLKLGQNRLFKVLRDLEFITNNNKPYQKYVDMGVFVLKEGTYKNTTTGDDVIYTQPRVTAKGQEYLFNKLIDFEKIVA